MNITKLEMDEGLTVKQIREFLKNYPDDLKVWMRGSGQMEKIYLTEGGGITPYIYLEGEMLKMFTNLEKIVKKTKEVS